MTSMRIAFVSSHPSMRRFRRDASYIYRCENLALALSALGHKVSLVHINALLIRREFDIAVFLRPSHSWVFDYVTDRLRARGTILIGDVDDLIFDPACAEFRPSVRNNLSGQEKTQGKFILHASALGKMDKMQFSTGELERRYLALHPQAQCAVIPNAGHRSWRAISPALPRAERSISYFSGTRTHDRDFSLVVPALEKLLHRYDDLKIRIVGPVSNAFDHPRVIKIKKVLFKDYPQLVRSSHISIAPLEDTPFNQCKSALKALEAGMMNVPIVASPVGDYSSMNVEGVLHAKSSAEWESQLDWALDPENYRRLSAGMRGRMHDFADVDDCATRFLHFATN